jgi:hypothetical protein
MKDRPVRMVGRYLKTPTVRLDNRPTNSKSNTRSAGLCCKEGLENTVPVFPIYSGSRILDGDQNMRGLLNNIGLNPQQACAINRAHCFNRICTQIKKNLLQLASIGNKLRHPGHAGQSPASGASGAAPDNRPEPAPAAHGPYDPRAVFALPEPASRYRSANGAPGPDYWQNRADYVIAAHLEEFVRRRHDHLYEQQSGPA